MLTSHLVNYDHTVTWCMCFVLFIRSNELRLLKPIIKAVTYVPLNSKVFEPRKTCSTKLLMSMLGCGYFAQKLAI